MPAGPSQSPTSSLVDWSDNMYNYVLNNLKTINPSRVVSGIVQARSWPIDQVVPESFYMLLGNESPLRTPGHTPLSAPTYSLKIQWAWSIIGSDIQATTLQLNRGDRYRTNFVMQQELLQAMYPFFFEKLYYTLDGSSGSPVLTGNSYYPKEQLWTKIPVFTDRMDKQAGVLFGYAITEVTGFSPTLSTS